MRPGPTSIKKCKGCGNLFKEMSMSSWSSTGNTYWTDGVRDAATTTRRTLPGLVACPHCGDAVLLAATEDVGEISCRSFLSEQPPHELAFNDLPIYRKLPLQSYFDFLNANSLAAEDEKSLRVETWRLSNDLRRHDGANLELSDFEVLNLTALVSLFTEPDPGDMLLKAEVLRELGRFDDARAVLTDLVSKVDALAERRQVGATELQTTQATELHVAVAQQLLGLVNSGDVSLQRLALS